MLEKKKKKTYLDNVVGQLSKDGEVNEATTKKMQTSINRGMS